jgi:hypothetical protein
MSDLQIPDTLLVPGDTIRVDYLIIRENATALGLASTRMKETIASDDRLDYQGSEHTYPVDLETGETSHIFSIYATVRRYRRGYRAETNEAITGALAATIIVSALSAVAIAWAGYLTYRTYTVVVIAQDSKLTAEEKTEAYEAINEVGDVSIGTGLSLAAVGAVLLIGLLLWSRSGGE